MVSPLYRKRVGDFVRNITRATAGGRHRHGLVANEVERKHLTFTPANDGNVFASGDRGGIRQSTADGNAHRYEVSTLIFNLNVGHIRGLIG